MRTRFISVFLILVPCLSIHAFCQSSITLNNINQLAHIVDTVEIKGNHAKLLITWLYDTTEINALIHPVKYDLESMRKFKKDSTFMPTAEDEQRHIEFIKNAGQNCFGYALDKYFSYHYIVPDLLFNENISLSRDAVKAIVEKTFIKTGEFSTKNKKHFKAPVEDGTLIIFRNKYDWIIHAFYHERKTFYSKNGALPAREYKQMKEIFKRYGTPKGYNFMKWINSNT